MLGVDGPMDLGDMLETHAEDHSHSNSSDETSDPDNSSSSSSDSSGSCLYEPTRLQVKLT